MNAKHEIQVRQWFDNWSKSRTSQRISPWLVYVQEQVLSMIDWTKVSRVLDIGCGSGKAVYEVAKCLELRHGAIACGCDLSTGMLKEGLNENAKYAKACFLSASAQSLPFAENSFDVVMCTIAFHHFSVPNLALEEFRRVLCAGGKVLIADVFRDISVGTWIFNRLHRWFETGHVKYYRIDEMLRMLRNASYKNIKVSKINPPIYKTKKIFRKVGIFHATNSL
jgi:ubiquinone/menaquinone biosynthesis C-methylase UbiE